MIIEIPSELKDVEPHLKMFVDAMVYKLHKNSHKGKWEDLVVVDSLTRLRQETEELQKAIQTERNVINIILESADVANFALITANIAIRDAGHDE